MDDEVDILREFVREQMVEAGLGTAAALAGLLGISNVSTSEDPQPHKPKQVQVKKTKKRQLSMREIRPIIQKAAARYDVSPALIDAVIKTESRYRPNARSSAGAMGLMQLMPKTADHLGVDDPYDPVQNVMGGTRYLSYLLRVFDGDVRLAVAAYNAGPTNVKRYDDVPPFKETQVYVQKVLERIETSAFADT